MSVPAARMGDTTVHGGVITDGCPSVLINGRPAARTGDPHTCPASEGSKSHEGGPILQGSPKVVIGGRPAARVGDQAACKGSADAIATGSPDVMVGAG